MTMKETPWPFFQHTDLLDFPGYRSRAPRDLSKFLREEQGAALKELFLRGKVDYLFQRYTAEQELTGMLLCLRPSNLEVTTLPCVSSRNGSRRRMAGRGSSPRTAAAAFFHSDHVRPASVRDGRQRQRGRRPGAAFSGGLEASLLKPFAKTANSWPLKWTPDEPFKNCFWIRNPNYIAAGVIRYEGSREMAVLDQKVARIAELREAHARVPEVIRHFHEPMRAFDEVDAAQ